MCAFVFTILLLVSNLYGLGSTSLLECEENSDCIAEGAACVNRLCECPAGKTFSTDGSKCMDVAIGYGATCSEDTQCAWLLGKYRCKNSACDCESGYRYHHGKCIKRKGLDESCTTSEECHVSNDLDAMVCTNGLCKCNEGYYERGDFDCRPVGKVGDSCALDSDCQYENGYCSSAKCTTKSASGTKSVKEEITHEAKEEELPNAFSYELEASCNDNSDCIDVEHSYCSPITKQCLCKRGYFKDNKNNCVGEIGLDVGCVSDSDCSITPRRCENNKCLCPLTHAHSDALDKCVKLAIAPDFSCTTDLSCQIMGSSAKCVEYSPVNKVCECRYGLTADYVCIDGESECSSCKEDSDCVDILNSVCKINGECACPNNYRLVDDTYLGAKCDDINKRCVMENSECSSDVCKCKTNCLQLDDTTCTKLAELGEQCSLDIQCSTLDENSECSSGTCKCKSNHILLGKCFPERSIGEYCVKALQCPGAANGNIQCRNSICQCPSTMEATKNGLDCTARGSGTKHYLHYSSLYFIVSLIIFNL